MTQIPCCCSYSPFHRHHPFVHKLARYLRRLPGPGLAENNNRLVLFDVCDEFIFGRVNRKFSRVVFESFLENVVVFCFCSSTILVIILSSSNRLIYKARREREESSSKDDLNSLRYSYHFLLGFSQHLLLRDEIIDVPSLFVHLINVDDDEERERNQKSDNENTIYKQQQQQSILFIPFCCCCSHHPIKCFFNKEEEEEEEGKLFSSLFKPRCRSKSVLSSSSSSSSGDDDDDDDDDDGVVFIPFHEEEVKVKEEEIDEESFDGKFFDPQTKETAKFFVQQTCLCVRIFQQPSPGEKDGCSCGSFQAKQSWVLLAINIVL